MWLFSSRRIFKMIPDISAVYLAINCCLYHTNYKQIQTLQSCCYYVLQQAKFCLFYIRYQMHYDDEPHISVSLEIKNELGPVCFSQIYWQSFHGCQCLFNVCYQCYRSLSRRQLNSLAEFCLSFFWPSHDGLTCLSQSRLKLCHEIHARMWEWPTC